MNEKVDQKVLSAAQDDPDLTPEKLKERFGRDILRDFDLDDPNFNDKFFETLDFMVEKCPVVHSKVGHGYYVVSRNEDVRKVGQDWRTFSNEKGFMPNRPEGMPFLMPEECDPPKHTNWRNVLNPHFSPKAVADYEAAIRSDVHTLVDSFIDRGECEFISECGAILPGWAFFKNILGVPIDQLEVLVHGVERGTFAPLEERPAHFGTVFETLDVFLKERASQPPRGDLVDTILAGVTYEDGSPAPWEDKLSILVDITFGGIATTTYVMASGLHYLATHPEQRKLLMEKPELMDGAIEEFIRVFPPVVALGRTCTRDVEVAGTQIKKDDFVLVNYAASSRDPKAVDRAHEIDITRDTVLHTAFGVGPHRCIGSNLARVELKAFFEEWLTRIPDFEVKPGTKPTFETGILRIMTTLNLTFSS